MEWASVASYDVSFDRVLGDIFRYHVNIIGAEYHVNSNITVT